MVEVEFSYLQNKINIQSNMKDMFEEIVQKYIIKSNLDINNIYFISDGKTINTKDKLENIMNESDKINKKIIILIETINNSINIENTNIKISNDIICPDCKEICKYEIKDYKIKLYDCKNGHIKDNINLKEFDNKQKIDISKIKCDLCKDKNKSNTYNNEFYICYECKINLCPLCKSIHDKTHSIINYDNKDYICNKHNETLVQYCTNCNKDICFSCYNEHKNHKIISYQDKLIDIIELRNKMNKFEIAINKLKINLEEIIKKLENTIENMKIIYNINNNILNNYEKTKKRNYKILLNLNYMNEYIENEINNIKNKYNYGYNINQLLNLDDIIIISNNQNNINMQNNLMEQNNLEIKEKMNQDINNINNNVMLQNNNQNNNKCYQQNNINEEIIYESNMEGKESQFGENFVNNNEEKSKIIYNNKELENDYINNEINKLEGLDKKELLPIDKNENNDNIFLSNANSLSNKKKRYDKDIKIKFNLDMINKDYLKQLRKECKNLFTEKFSNKIFSGNFHKQVEALIEMNEQIKNNKNISIYLDNLELILKIVGIIISNNLNTKIARNILDFFDSLFSVLYNNKHKLNETESYIVMSVLINNLSLSNNLFLKWQLLPLLNKYIEFLDTNKIMVTVINVALSKNNKLKTDILDLVIDLVNKDKLNISTKVYAKLIYRFLSTNDNLIKSKTLPLFQKIYSNIGKKLWKMIEISNKDREFLEKNLRDNHDIGKEDKEKEGEEDEIKNDDINNEINNSEGGGKNKILSNDTSENNNNINTDENKQANENSEKIKIKTTETSNKDRKFLEKNLFDDHDNGEEDEEEGEAEDEEEEDDDDEKFGNKNGPMTKEDLDIILNNLLTDDPNEKLKSIIIIHEDICGKFEQNKEVLIPNIDKIITTLILVSHKLFYLKDLNSIPIKFAKYLSIVFCKLVSNKELISHLSYNILLDTCNELLQYLLIDGLDRLGDKQEGNIIFKSINSTMLRILENCDITSVMSALLELIKEFHEIYDKKVNLSIKLSIKCLLKITNDLSQNINNIKISQILLQIHLLLLSLQKNNKDLNKKSQIDKPIICMVKNIIGKFVKYKKEKILEEYSKSVKNHQFKDEFLIKWIEAELKKSQHKND